MIETAQVAVVGAGPAGLASALALAALGCEVALVAPAYDPARAAQDTRTTALLSSSVNLLENIGVWQSCKAEAAPLSGVRIVDDRGDLLRAPEVLFQAAELGLADFGANIANAALVAALDAVARPRPAYAAWQPRASCGSRRATARYASTWPRVAVSRQRWWWPPTAVVPWPVPAPASACAPGQYPQAAVAGVVRHSRAHGNATTEFHRRAGPLTMVPLPRDMSSLVWVEEPAEARRLGSLSDQDFADALEDRLHGLLGSISCIGARVVFPLSGLTADCMGQNRTALVGEAAHVIPPIGAQGLNLGLRDACVLAECVAEARAQGRDVGGPDLLRAYHDARRVDVLTRTAAVDALNRSLLADFLPAQAVRGAGLHLLANIPSLRRLIMQGGMAPVGPLPRLMRRAMLLIERHSPQRPRRG